jgi:predicted nuclease of predicted toxin-antitoxin system
MKFLVDAQLPRQMAALLQEAGHDAKHTLDLPLGNRTTDLVINQLSLKEQRVVVTKDADFVDSFLLRQEPWKLLLVSTGNIRNSEMMALFQANLERVAEGFNSFGFIEINQTELIFHF